MSRQTAQHGTTPLLDVQYTRDALGRISERIEAVDGVTRTYGYEYDVAGRLARVWLNTTTNTHESYGYDSNGNRTHAVGNLVGTYDAQEYKTKQRVVVSASGKSMATLFSWDAWVVTSTHPQHHDVHDHDDYVDVYLPAGRQLSDLEHFQLNMEPITPTQTASQYADVTSQPSNACHKHEWKTWWIVHGEAIILELVKTLRWRLHSRFGIVGAAGCGLVAWWCAGWHDTPSPM